MTLDGAEKERGTAGSQGLADEFFDGLHDGTHFKGSFTGHAVVEVPQRADDPRVREPEIGKRRFILRAGQPALVDAN